MARKKFQPDGGEAADDLRASYGPIYLLEDGYYHKIDPKTIHRLCQTECIQ